MITAIIKLQGLFKCCGEEERLCSHLGYSAANALGGAQSLSWILASVPTRLPKGVSSANDSSKAPAGSAVGATAGQIQERK